MTDDPSRTYSIEEAARILGVSSSDIEAYIEEGLVAGQTQAAGAVLTRVQMRRLWSVVTLHRDLGINLAGVAAVLKLREQFEHLRRDLAALVEIVERELGEDVWDRLWPEGRPRPDARAGGDDLSDLPAEDGSAGPTEPAAPAQEDGT